MEWQEQGSKNPTDPGQRSPLSFYICSLFFFFSLIYSTQSAHKQQVAWKGNKICYILLSAHMQKMQKYIQELSASKVCNARKRLEANTPLWLSFSTTLR